MTPRLLLRAVTLALAVALVAGPAPARADDALQLNHPAGGWVYSGLTDDSGQITYAYPSNLIDRGGQKGRTLIEGHLKQAAGTARKPPTLVVNGNAMPLYADAEGRFARPYAFGSGSNGIEVRGVAGRAPKRVQFYEANRTKAQARIRIILAWDDPHAELDLHVLTPDGQHAFYANPVLSNGGGLDVDSVDGAGPEMFSMTAPLAGLYHVYVNYWGNINNQGYTFDEGARERDVIAARVTLVFDENTPAERRETYVVPMRKIGELVHVRAFRRAG